MRRLGFIAQLILRADGSLLERACTVESPSPQTGILRAQFIPAHDKAQWVFGDTGGVGKVLQTIHDGSHATPICRDLRIRVKESVEEL